MISDTKKSILEHLANNPQTSVVKLIQVIGISKQAIQKHLKELLNAGLVTKAGSPPKVFYSINQDTQATPAKSNYATSNLKDFVTITPAGNKMSGMTAFEYWCNERSLDVQKYQKIYTDTTQKYQKYFDSNGLINATLKIKNTFGNDCMVDECYYSSFSAIEIFGRTGMYSQLLYAKQSGNPQNMQSLFAEFTKSIKNLIITKNIQAIGFVAPTVPRKIQLMKELEKYLDITLPKVKITKIKNQYLVPQKTLSKPSDRKQNANETFVVEDVPNVNYILLIDDFVGSGSSFNAIATKVKRNHKCKIFCYAISGTPNGIINQDYKKFEVINEA